MGKSIEDIAKIAAEWWGNIICSPKFDNGDSSLQGQLIQGWQNALVKPVIDESKANFILGLTTCAVSYLKQAEDNERMILSVDYHPCKELREAAERAGISTNNFPIKTVMWVGKNYVGVRYGYGADIEYLYANSSFWTKCIEEVEEDIKRYSDPEFYSYLPSKEEREEAAQKSTEKYTKYIVSYREKLAEVLRSEEKHEAMTRSFVHAYGKAEDTRHEECTPAEPCEKCSEVLAGLHCAHCGELIIPSSESSEQARSGLCPECYVVGYCKECGDSVLGCYEIPDHPGIYECASCGHPHTKDELWPVEEV